MDEVEDAVQRGDDASVTPLSDKGKALERTNRIKQTDRRM